MKKKIITLVCIIVFLVVAFISMMISVNGYYSIWEWI